MRALLIYAAILLTGCRPNAAPDITLDHGWTRAAPAAASAAAYVTIVNRGSGDDRLLSVAVDGARDASLHVSSMDGPVMRMRTLDEGLEIPAGSTVTLAPNGAHVMLAGLASPLVAGERRSALFRFEKSGIKQTRILVDGGTGR